MKVDDKLSAISPRQLTERVGSPQPKKDATPPHLVAAKDTVDLSTRSREVQDARRVLAELPEIRENKVAAIRAQIEAGTYVVDSEKIAEKMIAEGLLNSRLK